MSTEKNLNIPKKRRADSEEERDAYIRELHVLIRDLSNRIEKLEYAQLLGTYAIDKTKLCDNVCQSIREGKRIKRG